MYFNCKRPLTSTRTWICCCCSQVRHAEHANRGALPAHTAPARAGRAASQVDHGAPAETGVEGVGQLATEQSRLSADHPRPRHGVATHTASTTTAVTASAGADDVISADVVVSLAIVVDHVVVARSDIVVAKSASAAAVTTAQSGSDVDVVSDVIEATDSIIVPRQCCAVLDITYGVMRIAMRWKAYLHLCTRITIFGCVQTTSKRDHCV